MLQNVKFSINSIFE